MLNPFKPGDIKHFQRTVNAADTAAFDAGAVHPVYATFALGRDAEWACRLFVLEMKEPHEEGIGTFLNVKHQSPALQGETVDFEATLTEVKGNAVICSFVARVGARIIATGETGQKIIAREKLDALFDQLSAS